MVRNPDLAYETGKRSEAFTLQLSDAKVTSPSKNRSPGR